MNLELRQILIQHKSKNKIFPIELCWFKHSHFHLH